MPKFIPKWPYNPKITILDVFFDKNIVQPSSLFFSLETVCYFSTSKPKKGSLPCHPIEGGIDGITEGLQDGKADGKTVGLFEGNAVGAFVGKTHG